MDGCTDLLPGFGIDGVGKRCEGDGIVGYGVWVR